jgi:spermidine/putrescine transport system permease protein
LFLNYANLIPFFNPGFWTIVIAHIMFCISFVVVTVKARIASLDPRLEQAAMDLYANEKETFRRVTLPLVAPGIAGAALLAFSLSFDDFIITNFNSGDVNTFPKFIYTTAQRGLPPQANVIGGSMFLIAMIIVLGTQFIARRRAKAF